MIGPSLRTGFAAIRHRWDLAVLLFAANLALAFVLALPVYFILADTLAPTGFSSDLARGFDVVLWADIMEKAAAPLQALPLQLFWMVPLYLIWKTAAGVGLIHALRGDQGRSFWQGVGRYTGKGLRLALLFLVALGIASVGVLVGALVLNLMWGGEVGAFWINFVIVPTLLISSVAVLDLMHDYARIALVVEEKPVTEAAATGFKWPIKHGQASWLYLAWFVPAALLLLLPTVLDMSFAAATALGIWGLFLVQQIILLVRAAVTVGWVGSEVALFEAVWLREAPLIAEATPEEEASFLADDDAVNSSENDLASA